MEHVSEAKTVEQRGDVLEVVDVALHEGEVRRVDAHFLDAAGQQVIGDDQRHVAVAQQSTHQGAADVASAAGQENGLH